ncbi:hypothetical protein J437_LFUL000904 [Ladona fulva]|uniref:5'-nucleotidase domain-containing protein 1 n=1 Tax=Ladona fulva TaxID=123851 RepID=A0A8K0P1T3_LADFU|nr:hypothetical protein J437_LFUL000904 [Ladona fulva]
MNVLQCCFFIRNRLSSIRLPNLSPFRSMTVGVGIYACPASKQLRFLRMKKSPFSTVSSTGSNRVFRFSDYDCIGFDLDNTLVRYKLSELMNLEYNVLSQYLVNVKGYDPKYLRKTFKSGASLVQRGLLLDFKRGNIVKLGPKGVVMRACHGTRFLSDSEIESTYGPCKIWEEGAVYARDPIEAWSGPLSNKVRALLDYFDTPAALVFARIIDSIEESGSEPGREVWPDILDGLVYMFNPDNFQNEYFSSIKSNVDKYVHSVDRKVLTWLLSLRQHGKKLFLLTGSGAEFVPLIAEHALGSDWRSLFDVTISYARKPWFFLQTKEEKPFVVISESNSDKEAKVLVPRLDSYIIYEQGSWDGLRTSLEAALGKKNGGKVLYVGDNLVQDIYAPFRSSTCETATICEEMGANMSFEGSENLVDPLLMSTSWGSFFGDGGVMSYWSEIINKYSKICIPAVSVCASKSVDFPFRAIYYPDDPIY